MKTEIKYISNKGNSFDNVEDCIKDEITYPCPKCLGKGYIYNIDVEREYVTIKAFYSNPHRKYEDKIELCNICNGKGKFEMSYNTIDKNINKDEIIKIKVNHLSSWQFVYGGDFVNIIYIFEDIYTKKRYFVSQGDIFKGEHKRINSFLSSDVNGRKKCKYNIKYAFTTEVGNNVYKIVDRKEL
jgi:hypothetical protein